METLEKRVLLSATGNYRLSPPSAGFEPTTSDIADVKNGPMSNVGEHLISIYREYRKFQRAGGADKDFVSSLNDLVLFKGASVGVNVRAQGSLDATVDRLRDSRAELIYRSRAYNVVQAYVPIGQLHELARDPLVATISPLFRFYTKQQGTSDNQADLVQKTDQVRANFGLDGSGVTVGVVSDSVNSFGERLAGSYATGDLPMQGVEVLVDRPFGTDEGRAMLELIHDIAPGAALQFAASGVSQLTFADSIRILRMAGSDVIVDDIGFFAEPAFQPGVLDQAIRDVVNDGAVYLSAAGNDGNLAYEAATNFTRIGRDRFVDFDPGPAQDTRLRVSNTGGSMRLWWDNPYNGVVGGATTDLDVYVYDIVYGRVVASATSNNIRTGIPFEQFNLPFGTYDIEIRVADHVVGTPLPTRFRLAGEGLQNSEYEPETRSAIEGHAGGEFTISVGAVPYFRPAENEDFSSHGPVRLLFDFNGNRLPAPLNLQKPDISGVDNVNTSFFGGSSVDDDQLPNFSGTSAAAPNVAALVALILEAAPLATQAEIVDALKTTALPLNGSGPGYDVQGGWGLVDAMAAIQTFITPPQVHIQAVRPDPRTTPVDSIKIVFSQRVVGFDLADLQLSRNGGPNLLTGAQTLQSTDNNRSFMLRELRGITAEPGTYTLTLTAPGSGITNVTSFLHPLTNSVTETWVTLPFPEVPNPPSDLKAKVVDEGVVRLRWTDNSAEEDRFVIERAEDPDFTVKVKTFQVPRNTTVYTDQVIVPVGKRVFYRVRAVSDFSGFQQTSNVVEVFLPGRGEIVLDNDSSKGVLVNGVWATVFDANALGETALEDLNTDKGAKSVRYTPNITTAGEYFVYARWTRASNRATNVPIDIVFANGQKQTVTVDQRNTGGEGWVVLGKFRFDLGTGGFVRIRTDGTNGVVSADAVRFQPASAVS